MGGTPIPRATALLQCGVVVFEGAMSYGVVISQLFILGLNLLTQACTDQARKEKETSKGLWPPRFQETI